MERKIWKRTPIDIQEEKNIIMGMILYSNFLKSIKPILKLDMLSSSYIKTIASWCLEYYDIYKIAPKDIIFEIFETKSRQDLEDSQINLISSFLENLPEYNSKFNSLYALDQSELYLKKRTLEILSQDLKTEINLGNIEYAESLITNFKRVERPQSVGVDVINNRDAIIESFENEEDTLFQLPGDLGKAIGGFSRGNFLGVVGPAGRGKTWWLLEIGIRALFSGLKVLFVSLEMTQPEIITRIHRMISGRPSYMSNNQIRIPYFDCIYNKKDLCNKRIEGSGKYSSCNLCKNKSNSRYSMTVKQKYINKKIASWRMAIEKSISIKKLIRTGMFKLICFPAKSKSILDIKNYLDNLEYYEHYVPDIIITDYADIMAPIRGINEYRHQINVTWEYHRGIAQERHCVVVTGSHSHKDTHERRIKKSDTSEDGRKMNHLTHAFALNQTPEEEEEGIMNINILKRREGKNNIKKEIVVLQSLDISKPYLDSYFEGYGNKKADEEKSI